MLRRLATRGGASSREPKGAPPDDRGVVKRSFVTTREEGGRKAAGGERGKQSKPSERGSVAVFTAVFAFAVLALLALLVDGGSALNAKGRAADIAEQGARAAVTDLSIPELQAGHVAIDWGTACGYAGQAVHAYAADFKDVTGATMTYCGPPTQAPQGGYPPDWTPALTAMVTVQVTTQPVIPGFPAKTFTETQFAAAACGNADNEEVCR
jgi:Flp pilus assembly protein TadG